MQDRPPQRRVRPEAQYSYWLFAWAVLFLLGLAPVAPSLSLWLVALLAALELASAAPRDPFIAPLVIWAHLAFALLVPPPLMAGAEGAVALAAQAVLFAVYLAFLSAQGTTWSRVQRRNVLFFREANSAEVVKSFVPGSGRTQYAYGYE